MPLLLTCLAVAGQVRINEFMAASSGRQLRYDATGTPRLGAGLAWQEVAFDDSAWVMVALPAGYGFPGLATDLRSSMAGRTPTLYLRREFTVTAAEAASSDPLSLSIECNDGFIAFLNGTEVARAHMGAPKGFHHHDQPAFNPQNTTGLVDFSLGAANSRLVPGRNVLAILAANAEKPGSNSNIGQYDRHEPTPEFQINLRLHAPVPPPTSILAAFDFSDAAAGSKTHLNIGGTITDTTSGTLAEGGWLATVANPESGPSWESLQIVATEDPTGGENGAGAMTYSLTQTGANQPALVRTPMVTMSGVWTPGNVSAASLAGTRLRFRYKSTGSAQFQLRIDPAFGQDASALTGFPLLGGAPVPTPAFTWSNAANGITRWTINSSGIGSSGNLGAVRYVYWPFSSPTYRNGQFDLREDNTEPSPNGGGPGVLRFTWITVPTQSGASDYWGWTQPGFSPPPQWPISNLSLAEMQRTRVRFHWKLTLGKTIRMWFKPSSGGDANRLDFGVLTGTGNWETFDRTADQCGNAATFQSYMASHSTEPLYLVVANNTSLATYAAGDSLLLDDINFYYESPPPAGWLQFDQPLSAASGGPAFIAALNVSSAVSFLPTLIKTSETIGPGHTFSLDDWQVIFTGPPTGATTEFIPVSAPGWKHFVGLAEPSGGVFDPALIIGFTPPPGAETDFDQPDDLVDWIELSNDADQPVDLGGWSLTDEADTPRKFVFPTGTTLPGHGHLVVLCDDREEANGWLTVEPATIIAAGSAWKYLDDGSNQGTAWRELGFPDSSWPSGPAPLGYSPNNEDGATTLIQGQGQHLTTYFRKSFTIDDPAAFLGALSLRLQRDDGAALYLNGAELLPRSNLPSEGEITFDLPATAQPGVESEWITMTIPAALLIAGQNVFAVEVHQVGLTSSDCRFDLELTGFAAAPGGVPAQLHAGFTLANDGEYLALHDAAGAAIDLLLSYPNQYAFASYGRNPTDPFQWGFFPLTSPGQTNRGEFYPARVEPPEFLAGDTDPANPLSPRLLGGFYNSPQTLYLKSPTPGATVRYTTDGSEPTESNGTVAAAAISLTAVSDRAGRVIRARAFLPGLLPSGIKTHTYLVSLNAALARVPALILTGDAGRNFYKPYGVMGIEGGSYDGAAVWIAAGPGTYNMALGQGRPFERETHMEFYAPTGYYPATQQPLRIDIGLRLSSSPFQRPRLRFNTVATASPWGPWWDQTERPNFNIYFRGDFGPGELDYPLFPGYDVRNFQNLRLRGGKNDTGNDSPFITDELVRRLWIDLGHVGPKGLNCAVFVNGKWQNIGNLTERIREPLLQAHYRSHLPWDVRYVYEWVNGDATAWNAMMTALNRDLSVLANLQALRAYVDLDNFADYYLLNIYAAMWDWPENNFAFARERSTGPNSVFRFLPWDAEGGFNVKSYYAKSVSFNSINDLAAKSQDVARIWQRLMLSAEWRLKMADRIHRYLFNKGVLDDRDPDGAGPARSHFQIRLDELVAEAGPMVALYGQRSFNDALAPINAWLNPTNGRRSYLLGEISGRRMFRDAGLWPLTEPPVLSQHGGVVPPGYSLSITSAVATPGQSAAIYYTVDGSDPRSEGGAPAMAASIYDVPIVLTNIVVIRARARNRSTAEWSALTEATFAPSAMPASSNNLVVAELMYHPPDVTSSESASGFSNADDFEFVRLLNIAAQPVDLGGVRFTTGVTFDFSAGSVRYLNPGAGVLVVKNRAAFRQRYGPTLEARIAGEFTGNLSNGGERFALANGPDTIRDFTFSDLPPWPDSPDGKGPSLVLLAPVSNPDHTQPANWIASAVPGGLPSGQAPLLDFDAWRALLWGPNTVTNLAVSGPDADPDLDGIVNLVEYALGLHPRRVEPERGKTLIALEPYGADTFVTLEYDIATGAIEAAVTLEVSPDLQSWTTSLGGTEVLWLRPNLDGTTTVKHRSLAPVSLTSQQFMRLRITGLIP